LFAVWINTCIVPRNVGGCDSTLAEEQIDDPAAAHVLAAAATVVQDVGVVAAGVLQRVA
jgi:hypothetical protein